MVRRGFMAAFGALFGVSASASAQAFEVPCYTVHSRKQDAELERRYGKPQRIAIHYCFVYSHCDKVNWSTVVGYRYGVEVSLRESVLVHRELYRDGHLASRSSYTEYADGTCEANA